MDGGNKHFGNLSTHFSKWEFKCPCLRCRRKKVRVSELLLFRLEILRAELANKPIIITSGNRCPEYNERVGGYPSSAHLTGEAADIYVEGVSILDIGLAAERIGGLRIGIGKKHVHLDIREPCPSKFWIYKTSTVYSAKIQNESLLEFYKKVKGG